MKSFSSITRHALSALVAVAITATLLVSSFATTPERVALTTVIA